MEVVAVGVDGVWLVVALQFQIAYVAPDEWRQRRAVGALALYFCERFALRFIHFRLPLHEIDGAWQPEGMLSWHSCALSIWQN